MSDHLALRGQPAETLFGFLGEGQLALVAWPLFTENCRLPVDENGAARCRLGGIPAALVQVTDALFIDAAALAAGWPRLVAELAQRVGEEKARALVASTPVLRVLRTGAELKELILEHQIRAEKLYLLGEPGARTRSLEGELRFAIAFERGTLELAYTKEAFQRALAKPKSALVPPVPEADVRWKGAAIALPRQSDLPWHEQELAEVAVIATMKLAEAPRDVVGLLEAAFPKGVDDLDADLAVGTILNVWGVALRNVDRHGEADRMLTQALTIAKRADPKLEQQVTYNLGYTKLARTMKTRQRVGARGGVDLFRATYDVDEKHRATWNECLALFERALALDASDETARAQIDQTRQLLAMLDGNATTKPKTTTSSPRPTKEDAPPAPKNGVGDWIPILFAVTAIVAFLLYVAREQARMPPPSEPEPAPVRGPSAREISEAARLAWLDTADLEALPPATYLPCPFTIRPPLEVPRGEVVAPHLGRGIGTGELYGTEYFDATIRQWAVRYAPSVDVRPSVREGIGPVRGTRPASPALSFGPTAVTVIVTGWRDPVPLVGGDAIMPGSIEARIVVWSHELSRLVCSATVQAENGALHVTRSPDLAGSEDDTLNRARLDLIEQALRTGIPRLTTMPP